MACRGFLQCLLKLFNLFLALVGVLLLVFSISLLVKEQRLHPPPPPGPAATPLTPLSSHSSPGQEHGRAADIISPQDHVMMVTGKVKQGVNPAEQERPPHVSFDESWLHPFSRRLGSGRSSSEQAWDNSVKDVKLPRLWFTYLLIGGGAYITLLTLIGAVAAESNTVCCLSTYQFGLSLLLLLQLVAAALIWMDEVPVDPTGEYDKRKQFVMDNLELCKLAALFLVLAEGTALLIAMMLRAIQADEASAVDDEEDYVLVPRRPLHQSTQRRLNYSQSLMPASQHPASPQLMQGGGLATPGGTSSLGATTGLLSASSAGQGAGGAGTGPSGEGQGGSAGGVAWGIASPTPYSDMWRARLMEKYGMDPNDLQYGAVVQQGSPMPLRTTSAIPAREQSDPSGQKCLVM